MVRRDTIHFRKTVLSICRWTLAACSSDSSQRCALHGCLPWRSTYRRACKDSAVQPAFCAKERTSSLPFSTPPNLSSFSRLCAWWLLSSKLKSHQPPAFRKEAWTSTAETTTFLFNIPEGLWKWISLSPLCWVFTWIPDEHMSWWLCRYHEVLIKN